MKRRGGLTTIRHTSNTTVSEITDVDLKFAVTNMTFCTQRHLYLLFQTYNFLSSFSQPFDGRQTKRCITFQFLAQRKHSPFPLQTQIAKYFLQE